MMLAPKEEEEEPAEAVMRASGGWMMGPNGKHAFAGEPFTQIA